MSCELCIKLGLTECPWGKVKHKHFDDGAFVKDLAFVICHDFAAKAKLLETNQVPDDASLDELLFGDIQNFVDEWKKIGERK